MNLPLRHPIYQRLLAPAEPAARHSLLHDMERQLAQLPRCAGLHTRIHSFVDRGVPYFAPTDSHYCEWAARAVQLWDELDRRSSSAAVAA